MSLTDKEAITLFFDYYTGQGFSISDTLSLFNILLKVRILSLVKLAYDQAGGINSPALKEQRN